MSEIVTQPEGVLITGPLIDAAGKSRIVSIQNVPSGLWAYAVASGEAGTAEIDSVVAQGDSGNTKTDPAQLWELLCTDAPKQHFRMQNVGSKKFAFFKASHEAGDTVLMDSDPKEWQIKQLKDDETHYRISPVGSNEGTLYWTHLRGKDKEHITLESGQGERSHWLFRDPPPKPQ